MTTYTADDFKRARFAEHPSGGVACKAGDDQPWIHPSLESDREFFLVDEIMAERGWAPVPAGSYTRTDEDWKARAEKAERERDEARADLAEYVQAQALRTQPRPLTPDAITDEMVLRFWNAFSGLEDGLEDMTLMTIDEVRLGLRAALTEPPARPEGAAEIEVLLWHGSEDDEMTVLDAEDRRLISNYLASRGVRIVTEERP